MMIHFPTVSSHYKPTEEGAMSMRQRESYEQQYSHYGTAVVTAVYYLPIGANIGNEFKGTRSYRTAHSGHTLS